VPRGTLIVDAGTLKSALAEQGIKAPFGKALDGGSRVKALARVRKAASASGVDATLIVQMAKSSAGRHVRVLLVATAGAAGDLDNAVVLDAKPSKDDDEKLAACVGTALVDYRATSGDADKSAIPGGSSTEKDEQPPVEPPETVSAAPSGAEPEVDTALSSWEHPRGIVGHNLFEVSLGPGAMGRHFTYALDARSSPNLLGYNVFPAPLLSAQGEVYPLADARIPLIRDFGLIGSVSQTVLLRSTVDGGTVDTTALSYLGGLRWRAMPTGDASLQLGISLSYSQQSFEFDTPATTAQALPSVDYRSIRPAADVRVQIGKLSLLAQGGLRAVLSAGDVALRFRGATTTGFDVGAGAALTLATGWEARVAGDYEGYFYSFASTPGDLYRAQGASDQMYGARIAIACVF
jgi:hypothetical protein